MKEKVSRLAFPVVLTISGLVLLAIGGAKDQNGLFMMASVAIALVGAVSVVSALGFIKKGLAYGVLGGLVLIALALAAMDYKSIKDPIEFTDEKVRRSIYVVQRLKDIRHAEIAFKNTYGGYCPDFDSLLNFIRTDSFNIIKAIGNVPDTLTEEQAVELGIVSRDTSLIPVGDSLYSPYYLADRYGSFNLDSLPYIPFGKGEKFELEASSINRGNVNVPVFQVTAMYDKFLLGLNSQFYRKSDMIKVGDINNPSTSGSWD